MIRNRRSSSGSQTGASALIVLARYPRPGAVSQRLAAALGEQAATEFYRSNAERLFQESQRLPSAVRRYLFYGDAGERAQLREWVRASAGNDFRYEPQAAGNFGERMADAFRTVFAQGARKAVVVSGDIPDLSAETIQEALRLLDHYPLVIGPENGGGYYLLGMKMLYADLFLRRLQWGTSRVYGQTLRIMQLLELTPAFLPSLIAVETEADLRRWLQQKRRGEEDQMVRLVRSLLQ